MSERAARACLALAQHGAELLRGRSARLRPLAEEARETIARWVEIDRDYHPDWPEAPRQQIAWIRVRRAEQASRAFPSQRLRDALGAWRDSDERVSPEEEWRRVALALEDYVRVLEPLMEDSAYTDEELLAATREAADAAWVVADYAEARRHAEAEAA